MPENEFQAATTPAADAAATPSPQPAPASAPAQAAQRAQTPAQRAVAAAMADPDQNAGSTGEQAADRGTPAGAANGEANSGGTPAAGAQSVADNATAAGSTVEAPSDWPIAQREQFGALPADARALTMQFYKHMQAGFTQAMQTLQGERGRLGELADLAQAFESDPRAVLERLAAQKNVQVWFERPAATEEVPDFDSPADMAQWVAERVQRETARASEQQEQQRRQQETRTQAEQTLQRELQAARTAHADFDTHQAGVYALLQRAPGLSVDEAYGLATLAGLRTLAQQGQAAQAELQALRAQVERDRAALTTPVIGQAATAVRNNDKHLSPAQRAVRSAVRDMAANG